MDEASRLVVNLLRASRVSVRLSVIPMLSVRWSSVPYPPSRQTLKKLSSLSKLSIVALTCANALD